MSKRRALDYITFDDLQADLDGLKAGGYQTVGKWSLAQICDHLQIFFDASLDGFGFRMPWYMRMAAPLVLRVTLKSRKIPAGVKGPPSIMPRANGATDAAAIDSLIAAIDRYRRHNGPLQPSPLFGHLSRERWDQIQLIHAAHHLSFVLPPEAVARSS